jgi:hypothetical protein
MKNWPWITTIIAVFVLALTPVGWDLIAGLMSGEALSRNIAGGVLTIVMLILLVLGLLEWLIRWKINSRPNFPPPAQTTISEAHKPDKSEA